MINYETRAAIGSATPEHFIYPLEYRHIYQVWPITPVMLGESNLGFIIRYVPVSPMLISQQ